MAISWPYSRQQILDSNGAPLPGAKAYFFDAGTETPRTVYTDSSLSVAHSHPVVADSNGRFPRVYLPTGLYRERITTSAGSVIWDDDNVDGTPEQTISGGASVDAETIFSTGDLKPRYSTGALAGWVRCNGLTIGSGSSGASERANDDTEDLFTHLWNNDSNLSVSGGRGASAAADWGANKTIALPSSRGRPIVGLDDMGNSAANVIQVSTTIDTTNGSPTATVASATGLAIGMYVVSADVPSGTTISAISGTTLTLSANATATASTTAARFSFFTDAQTLGAMGGSQAHVLDVGELAAHDHDFSGNTDGHTHATSLVYNATAAGSSFNSYGQTGGGGPENKATDSKTDSFSGTSDQKGSSLAHSNLPPGILATIYIKL